MQKHHYVPECYLKEFATKQSKQIQIFNIKNNKLASPKTPAQVCYEQNRFRIRSSDTLKINKIDPEIVEREFFKKVENAYPKIINKVKILPIKDSGLSLPEAKLLLQFLISIKKRGDDYRGKFLNKQIISEHIDFHVKDLLPIVPELSKRLKISEEDFKIQLEEYKEAFLRNDDKIYDNYLLNLKDNKIVLY